MTQKTKKTKTMTEAPTATPTGSPPQLQKPTLTTKEALKIRATLFRAGKAICEGCKAIGDIRGYIVTMYRGQVLTSACPTCQRTNGILISPTDKGFCIKLVPPDRDTGSVVEVAPANALNVLDAIGPKVEKREL